MQTILVLNKEFFQFLNLKSAVCYQERFKIKSRLYEYVQGGLSLVCIIKPIFNFFVV